MKYPVTIIALVLSVTPLLGQRDESPNRSASATIDGIRQIRDLHLLTEGIELLEVIELVPPSRYAADTISIIKSIDNHRWQSVIDDIRNLDDNDRATLIKLAYKIRSEVDIEIKKARRSNAPNKQHLARERKMWTEINSAVQYRSPQRLKTGLDFSTAPAIYMGTTKAVDLRLKHTTRLRKNRANQQLATAKGILLFPTFDLIDVPCFGVKIDIKITFETPPGAPHPFKKNKFGQMEGIEIPGESALLVKGTSLNSFKFLLNGSSHSAFSIFLDDKDINLPPGIHVLNASYQVFLDEVPAVRSAVFPIRYHKK